MPENALPSLDDFLAGLDLEGYRPAGVEGHFPQHESQAAQLALSVDFKKFQPRQAAYLRHRLEGKNKAEAARLAGYSEQYAAQTGSRLEKALADDIHALMDQHGMTLDFLMNKLREGLEANAGRWNNKAQMFEAVPDNAARYQNLKIALTMHGALREDGSRRPSVIVVNAGVNRPRLEVSIPDAEVVDEIEDGGQGGGKATAATLTAEAAGVS